MQAQPIYSLLKESSPLMSSVEMECFPLKEVPETKCPNQTLSLPHSVDTGSHGLWRTVFDPWKKPWTSVFWVFPWAPQPHPCCCSSRSPLGWSSVTRTHKHCHWVQIPEMKLVRLSGWSSTQLWPPKQKNHLQMTSVWHPMYPSSGEGHVKTAPPMRVVKKKKTLITHAHALQPLTRGCLKNHSGITLDRWSA